LYFFLRFSQQNQERSREKTQYNYNPFPKKKKKNNSNQETKLTFQVYLEKPCIFTNQNRGLPMIFRLITLWAGGGEFVCEEMDRTLV